MSVIKKKKHVSKKNKKDWRKHCDIRDVEDFMEDQRLEERLGKFETKADSELFVVDTGAKDQPEVVIEKPLTAKQRKRAALSELPKCFEVLQPSSKVEDPNKKRNHVNPVGTKLTALSKITEKKRQAKGAFEKKVETARKNRKMALDKKRKVKKIRETFDSDLWGVGSVPEAKGIPETLVDDFISTEAQLHNVLTERRLRARPPAPPTLATRAAVEAPHPGISYNPSYQEHQDLLQAVGARETVMMRRERHLHRVTTDMFRRVTEKQKEEQWRTEMSSGLAAAAQDSSESEGEYCSVGAPVRNKKKDHKARRKQREQLVEKERLKREKINRKKISDIYTLRKLEAKIVKTTLIQAKEREIRKKKREESAVTALPRLSAHKTPVKEPELVEPSTLSGDLRTVTSNGNPLRDRFESLQRRGALPATRIVMTKKPKVKAYFKPGHKVTDEDVARAAAKTNFKPRR